MAFVDRSADCGVGVAPRDRGHECLFALTSEGLALLRNRLTAHVLRNEQECTPVRAETVTV